MNKEQIKLNRNTSCCFTGHRIEKLPWRSDEHDSRCLALKIAIAKAVKDAYYAGIKHFICGMATGCDMYFCEAVMALRSEREDITLEAALPWDGQASRWPEALKARHSRLVEDCDYITVVQHDYTPDCLMRRNRYMVDCSSRLIAASGGKPGGTMSTMLYALREGLEIIEIEIIN
ncbi:MAG: DUF1273 domain-containing protein [Oscillospiraceae bacterium]|jgi:uncharacterized phage-like protein YoqJ|nr:DUF1273 domain-containing protein [Oscillospiraceae bacterium]